MTFIRKSRVISQKSKSNHLIPSVIETLEEASQTRILQGFHSRRFFINQDGDKLIQMQPDKLLFNWKKQIESVQYPKFESVLNDFTKIYDLIQSNNINLTEKLNQQEVTFVDHIFIKDYCLSQYKLAEIFNYIKLPNDLKSVDCTITIPKKEINGSLILVIKSAKSNKDQSKLLVVETTCRGMKDKSETMSEWYKKSHLLLVDFFVNLFSDKSKNIWGIK